MFRQKVISVLLALLVVQCPYLCRFAHRCCSGPAVEVGSCCSCCDAANTDSETDPSVPDSPQPGSCGDCFCNGAIAFAPDTTTHVDDDANVVGGFAIVAIAPQVEGRTGQLDANSLFLPLIASGHRVRAALSSWQI